MKATNIVADYATDPKIERRTKEFLKGLNTGDGKPMEQLTPVEARMVLEGAQNSVAVDLTGIDVTERMINQDGLSVRLYIVKPSIATGILPAFMFFHGGGWVLGDFATHKRFVRDLVVHSGVAAVFVEYTRSPEAKYPLAINEAYAATKWVSENGHEINIDGSRLAVAGNSAGGNLAAAVALMAKEKNGPMLNFQLLFWPVTNSNFETESYNKFSTSRFLTKNMMTWFWDNYVPASKRDDIYAAPLK
ncbi:MAG: alpha/beta hydrolase, partial [Chitinophagaceae bacterium]